ncbi:TetR/AcrR family transcriptional regulator [Vulgatibacter incomptus]|uniref:HTH tetR-type domain-containing protein n=1 Tax=Vulgatibacter incomptus TaxID=1391653 RepID=A0A0K1PJG3_9BACT|nr:hypothetical protein [Vulgatibacter incomptus]AKU93224.1 hypothetical protein AKJ08_3611 [Vulgatibacter incomptus]
MGANGTGRPAARAGGRRTSSPTEADRLAANAGGGRRSSQRSQRSEGSKSTAGNTRRSSNARTDGSDRSTPIDRRLSSSPKPEGSDRAAASAGGERRHELRRQAIARACIERLSLEGLEAGRLETLAADAGLSRQNLLFYFRDKADLWAEAATCAAEEIFAILTRLVAGEAGPAAIRAVRRGLDEVARVLPAAFAVHLDAAATATRASATQQQRASTAQQTFLAALAAALASPAPANDPSQRLARLATLTFLAHHRAARAHQRSGLAPDLPLAADLDLAELHLVGAARTLPSRSR